MSVAIAHDVRGAGPPVLLLHGFPQTRALWDDIAADLAADFTCVTADLRGYGASPKPDEAGGAYAFREMAADMTALMTRLGFDRFHLVGHDRGARVAHRLALDAPGRVASLTVMDIVPTRHLLENWTRELALAYWHWTLLPQPAPFPERLIGADPDAFFETCLLGWGGADPSDFARLETYRAAWRDADAIRGMCADYRAAVGIDLQHDRADAGRRVDCPALVVWGETGVMARLCDVGATWADYLSDYRTATVAGGHFFVDTNPGGTLAVLRPFLEAQAAL